MIYLLYFNELIFMKFKIININKLNLNKYNKIQILLLA